MKEITIKTTAEERKAIAYYAGDPGVWLQTAWNEKAALRINATIKEKTDRNPGKISNEEKINLIKALSLPERDLDKQPTPPIK